MMNVKEFQHFFPTWEIYPRVSYFLKRYVDLHSRFLGVMNAIPTTLHSAALLRHADKLSKCFRQFLTVTVVGEEDIPPADFIVSSHPFEQIKYQPVASETECVHICICHAYVGDLGQFGKEEVLRRISYFAKSVYQRCRGLCFPVIICETRADCPEDTKATFCQNIRKEIDTIPELCKQTFHILIGPNMINLKNEVSNILESEIIAGFQKLSLDLQRFMRKEIRNDKEHIVILESESVVTEIRGFLKNRRGLIDLKCLGVTKQDSFIDVMLENLSRKIMCAAVAPMAIKYSLPDAVCFELLDEIHFDKHLSASVSKNTKHHLQKLEEKVELLEKKVKEESKAGTKCVFNEHETHRFDFVLYNLQGDMKTTVESTEKKFKTMEKITTVMRKMIFEIGGYIRQVDTTKTEKGIDMRELSEKDITPELRDDILRTNGVYGMGTLYGKLEIHLVNDLSEEVSREARDHLKDVMKKRQFHHLYVVHSIDENAKPLSGSRYEQGDKLISRFPNTNNVNREGTLGCFVEDKCERLFCLTCAHVVHPHNKPRHVVLVCKDEHHKRFGLSTLELTIVTGEQDLALIDFAAVTIHESVKSSCDCCIRDEHGNTKPARIADESTSELVGSRVYKRGAKTGLTTGIIASNNYCFSSDKSKEHLLVVDPLPSLSSGDTFVDDKRSDTPTTTPEASTDHSAEQDPNNNKPVNMRRLNERSSEADSENLETASNKFADEGDSGSVVCMDDLANECIVVISMISAGHLTLKGSESSDTEKCFSFMLHKALANLEKKSGTSFVLCSR